MKLNITSKLVGLFLVFGLTPMTIMGILSYNSTLAVDESTVETLKTSAQNVADKIDRNLFERYGDVQAFGLNTVSHNRDFWYDKNPDTNSITQAMNSYVDTYDIYYLTLLVDLEGKVIACNSKDQDGNEIDTEELYEKNYSNAPWFVALKNGKFTTKMPHTAPGNDVSSGTYIEDLYIDEEVKEIYAGDTALTLGFSAPVYQDGEVIGFWNNRAKFALVEEIVSSGYKDLKNVGWTGAEITLLDNKGRVIVDYDPASYGSETPNHDFAKVVKKLNLVEQGLEPAKLAVAGETGTGYAMHARKGLEQGVGYTHLKGALGYPGMDWAVLVRASEADMQAATGTASARNTMLITFGGSLLAILTLGLWFGRKISRPIVDMAKSAELIANGDLTEDITFESTDETGQLATSFRSVSSSLRNLNTEIQSIVQSALAGELNDRADVEQFKGCYRELISGMNNTLDAFCTPAEEAVDLMEHVANGKLSDRMDGNYQGEFKKLSTAINTAVDNIDEALTRVSQTGQRVANSSTQVQTSSQMIAEGATEQASSIEEIASSLEEMTSMTKQSADNAHQAKLLADETQSAVDKGNTAMGEMAEAIQKIHQSSDEQAKIVKTIDEIAFQTNLLALNAAVEAARAGEAGKGFAVVAEEVRNLAQRSAEAARTTATMIDSSVESSKNGVAITSQVAEMLTEIRTSASKTNDLVAEIAAASSEQAQGIDQVNTAIAQLDKATQQAAETSQESAGTAGELNRDVEELKHLVGQFSLSENATGSNWEQSAVNDLKEINKSLEPVRQESPSRPQPVAANNASEELIPFEDDGDLDSF